MTKLAKRFLECESGATAIEYAFIATLIAMALIAALMALGASVNNSFGNIAAGFP